MSAKQDRTYTRTAADLERKYNLEKVFAKDIRMTGKFESTAEAYLPPTYEDAVYLLRHIFYPDDYPLPDAYDFDLNDDGALDEDDAILAYRVVKGEVAMQDVPGAKKTEVTLCINMSDPVKTIRICGKNMWGTVIESYIGADIFNCSFAAKNYLDRLVRMEDDNATLYRYMNGEKEYFNPPMIIGVEYRTVERWMNEPVYTRIMGASETISNTIVRKSETITLSDGDYIQVWYIKQEGTT